MNHLRLIQNVPAEVLPKWPPALTASSFMDSALEVALSNIDGYGTIVEDVNPVPAFGSFPARNPIDILKVACPHFSKAVNEFQGMSPSVLACPTDNKIQCSARILSHVDSRYERP